MQRKRLKVLQSLFAGSILMTGMAGTAQASSHREAPLIAQDSLADATDLYAFVSPDDPNTVTFIANYIPLQEPASGPNFWRFDDSVRYEIKIDNNGDTVEDITFRFTFKTKTKNPNTFLNYTGPVTSLSDPDINVEQTMTVQQIAYGITSTLGSNLQTCPSNVGPATMPDYEFLAQDAVQELFIKSIKVFAGQRDEAFYVDLGSTFDLLQLRSLNGGDPTDNTAGFNVSSIAIQVPISLLTRDGSTPTDPTDPNAIIGIWTTASRPSTRVMSSSGNASYSGTYVQVSRLGMPLVNEVVIPLGQKNRFNASRPKDDVQFLSYVQYPELGGLLTALYGVAVPPGPRDDLVAAFLTGVPGLNQPANVKASEQLRLNMAIEPVPVVLEERMGVLAGDLAGFPNGRRLNDDVVDIALQVVGGVLVGSEYDYGLGDGVDENDVEMMGSFPYIPTPRSGFDSFHGLAY